MADEIAQKIAETPRLRKLAAYLQSIFLEVGKPLQNEELEKEIFQDIADLSALASLTIAKDKAVKEAKGGEE